MVRNVATIVGSLRKESFNRKVAIALQSMAPPSLRLNVIEIGDLPLYNEDIEEDSVGASAPEAWARFRKSVNQADALLFVTPEYNRSIPGVLKNAIDIGSRPLKDNVWAGKPGAIVSATPGGMGAFGANHHLRQVMVAVNVPLLQQPEMYLSHIGKVFDESGFLKEDQVKKLLEKFIAAYAAWIERLSD